MVQLTSDKKRGNAIQFYEKLGFVRSHEGLKLTLAGVLNKNLALSLVVRFSTQVFKQVEISVCLAETKLPLVTSFVEK